MRRKRETGRGNREMVEDEEAEEGLSEGQVTQIHLALARALGFKVVLPLAEQCSS